MKQETKICGTCRYFVKDYDGRDYLDACYYNPPIVRVEDIVKTIPEEIGCKSYTKEEIRPNVREDEFCGKWEGRKKDINARA